MTILRYVSPSGSDANSGLASGQAWATLAFAKSQIRDLIAADPTDDISLVLAAGRHAITAPLDFDERDSGTYPGSVVWRAAVGTTPVISGGVVVGNGVDSWTLHDAPNNIWVADFAGTEFRQLYVNGIRCYRARRVGGLEAGVATSIGFNTTDEVTDFDNPADIEFGFRKDWYESQIKVASVVASTSITMANPAQSWYLTFGNNNSIRLPTWIENAYEILEANADPATFYLDRTTDKVYLIPPAGVSNPNSATVIAPQLEVLATCDGADNIQFEGISFEHATWLPTNGGFVEVQAGLVADAYLSGSTYTYDKIVYYGQLQQANIIVRNSRNVTFNRCQIRRMGSHGLFLDDGALTTKLIGCVITDCSGHGVVLGTGYSCFAIDPPTDTLIDNCVIHDVAVEFLGCIGICGFYPRGTTIRHCDIADLPYSGISIGLGWTRKHHYRTSPNAGNRVLNCRIRDVMQTMDDGGGIYTNGPQRDTLLQGNYITGIPATNGVGIYLDEGSQRIDVNRNVVADCTKWFKHHRALGDITTTNNHSDTLNYEVVARDVQGDSDYNGATAYVYSVPTIFDPDSPGSAQQRIILDAGLEAEYEDLLDE